MRFEWEMIDDEHGRAMVPGGWLVKAWENVFHNTPNGGMESGWDCRVSIAFVPDPSHTWKIDKENTK